MATTITTTTAIRTVRSRSTRLARWLKRRRERKQVLEKLRKLVPFVNANTPLLELLQKVIDYITELQQLLSGSSVNAIENKENISSTISLRTNESGCKIFTQTCAYRSSSFT